MTSNIPNIKKLVCFTTNPEAYALTQLGEEAANRGIAYQAIAVDDLSLVVDKYNQTVLLNNGNTVDLDNAAVIIRCLNRKDRDQLPFSKILLNHLLRKNIPVLNSAMWKMINSADKLDEYHLLRNWGLPVPSPTHYFASRKEALDFSDWSFPSVRKPRRGSHGKGIVKINNRAELEENLTDYPERFIWQQCIESDHDLRVFATKETVIGAISRRNDSSFVNNISAGGKAEAYDLSPEAKKLCLLCCQKFNADIIGIDIIIDQNDQNLYILEVDQTNQFEGFEKATGINVAAWHLKALGIGD